MDTPIQISHEPSLGPHGNLPSEIPVLIIGGGPVGLTSSLFLSHFGIRSLLVEQHPGTSTFPKSRFIKARTMEIFRQVGIDQSIFEAAIPKAINAIWARSLAGEELDRRPIETAMPDPVRTWSPTWGCTCTQDLLEPVLLTHARRQAPAQIRFNTQLASIEQRDDHVLATIVHRPSGRVWQVSAQYLIGADGNHSAIRQALGIRMVGQPILSYRVNMLFRADLARWVGDREINMCFIMQPEGSGLLYNNGGDRWRYGVFYHPEQGQRPEDFTPERCTQLIRAAVGVPDLSIQLDEITPWNDTELIAERFFDRRVFLAGDAAHVMSPAGGFGMNVGIADAHNLAWKLAAVLKGWALPALLGTYEEERLPVARAMMAHTTRTLRFSAPDSNTGGEHSAATQPLAPGQLVHPDLYREHGLVFGVTYDSALIVPDGTPPGLVSNPITEYLPNARPGSRAPHVWLERNGARISTLDLFGREFVLLSGAEGQDWCDAAQETAHWLGIPLQSFRVGHGGELNDSSNRWQETYGTDASGAVLIRPDGYVAWRCATLQADPSAVLKKVMRVALALQPVNQHETM